MDAKLSLPQGLTHGRKIVPTWTQNFPFPKIFLSEFQKIFHFAIQR